MPILEQLHLHYVIRKDVRHFYRSRPIQGMAQRIPEETESRKKEERKGTLIAFPPGTAVMVAGFEFPKQAKAQWVPAEQSIGIDDQEGIHPILDAPGDEDEPEAIGLSEAGFLNLVAKNDELLAQECVLEDELSFASRKIGDCGDCNRITGLGEMEDSPFEN